MHLLKKLKSGGGWPAIRYALRMARQSGGIVRFYRALKSKNACKTCALGMGGQHGGMVDESGRFPEICKKSMQAMAADMQGRIEPRFFAEFGFSALRGMTPRELEHMGRLVEPVLARAGDSHYRAISWEEATAFCVERFRAVPANENFFYASGRSSNEAAFLLHLFARMYGTNNVNNCSYYCHQASGVGLTSALGSGTATIQLEDLKKCDTVFVIGGNPASNHPRLMRQLVELRRRGGTVIVINPMRELGLVRFSVPSDLRSLLLGSSIASIYVQPHIGGDIALLSGISKCVIESGGVDDGFVRNFTEGAEEAIGHLRSLSWEVLERESGVSRQQIEEVARAYLRSERTVFSWTMGITQHKHGSDNVRAIVNLALLGGMVGKPGAGLLPIRGHSNVQGIGSVGVTPKLKQAIFDRLESHFKIKLPTEPGMDTLSCIEAMNAGRIRNAWCLGGNLFGASPDLKAVTQAFAQLDSIVYLSTTLNTGHAWGRAKETLILPVLPRDEESQATTQESMFNYVRLSEGGPARHVGPRAESGIIAEWADRVLGSDGPVDWRSMADHGRVRDVIAAVVPGLEEVSRIGETKKEFQIDGRTLHQPRFNTPSGKARFHVVKVPGVQESDSPAISRCHTENALRLMTVRSEGQFNTVVYEDEDIYRGQERRDVILMNREDIERLGLLVDQRVRVVSSVGAMRGILVREFDIRAGNAAMYCPEANVLIPREVDPESRTPVFKSIDVTVEADSAADLVQVGVPASVDGQVIAWRDPGAAERRGKMNVC